MKRFKSIAAAAMAVLIAAVYALPAVPAYAATSASLSIAPKKNYVIEPGKSVKDKLLITNLDSKNPLELSLRVADFTFTDDTGTPKLFLAQDAPQTTWSLKPFLTIPESVTIPAGGSKTLEMNVAIPAKQGAGSYYSAIVYSAGAPNGGNVGLGASGVTLVFTSVPGQVHEDLKLKKFGIYHIATPNENADYSFISAKEPVNVAYTLLNNGNVAEAPVGSITLKDMFGHTYVIDNVNPNGSLALIGQTRTFTACIKLKSQDVSFSGTKTQAATCVSPGMWPGRYSAALDLFYGQNGNETQEILSNTSFWYLPGWFMLLCLVVLAVFAYVVWRAWRFVRKKLGYQPKRSSHNK